MLDKVCSSDIHNETRWRYTEYVEGLLFEFGGVTLDTLPRLRGNKGQVRHLYVQLVGANLFAIFQILASDYISVSSLAQFGKESVGLWLFKAFSAMQGTEQQFLL